MSTRIKQIADDYLDGKIDIQVFKKEINEIVEYVEIEDYNKNRRLNFKIIPKSIADRWLDDLIKK